jgi:acetyltransferase-like isoleucine patch superfamily enzyme
MPKRQCVLLDQLISPLTKPDHNYIIKGKVLIKKYSQLGVETIVFPSVTSEEGCATGTKSLVIKSTLLWGIYVGQPALRIKERSCNLLKFLPEYD